jgi:hypothetical protein
MRPRLAFFLRAKHWQLFALLMGAMFIAQAAMVANMPTTVSPEAFQRTITPFMVVTILFMGGFLAWLWVLGRFLWSVASPNLRLNIKRFRLSLIYPLAYAVLFAVAMQRAPTQLPTWIIPLHLLAMFCMFYNLYFVAKALRLAEVQKPLGFYDYSGPFFLLWFFPIGIWVIQPRINRLYALHPNVDV